MALSKGARRRLFAAIMLLRYARFALTHSRDDTSSQELLDHLHLIKSPIFLYKSQPMTLSIGTEDLSPKAYDSYDVVVQADDAEWQSAETDDDATIPMSNGNSRIASSAEGCSKADCRVEVDTLPLDSHTLSLDEPTSMARHTDNPTSRGQIHTLIVRLMPRESSSSTHIGSMPPPQWRVQGVTTRSGGPRDDANTNIPEDAYKVSSPDEETFLKHSYNDASSFVHHLALQPKTAVDPGSIQHTGVTQTHIAPRSAVKPAQVVELLLHPTEGGLQRETSDPPYSQSAVHTIMGGEPFSEQTDETEDERHRPTEEVPRLHQEDVWGRLPRTAAVYEDCSQWFPCTRRGIKRSADVRVAHLSPQNNLPGNGAQHQTSCKHQQRELHHQQQQQQPNKEAGGVLWRRLAAASWRTGRPYASAALEMLKKKHVASPVFSAHSRPERQTDATRTGHVQEEIQRTENSSLVRTDSVASLRRGEGTGCTRRRQCGRTLKTETEALARKYERFLEEEAERMGISKNYFDSTPFRNALLVGSLMLFNHPAISLYAMGISIVSQLLHLDASLEQQSTLHTRARQRLAMQYLKEAAKENERLNPSTPTTGVSGENSRRRQRQLRTADTVHDKNVLKLLNMSSLLNRM